MAPKLIVDPKLIDLGCVLVDKEGIRSRIPQRFQMEQIDAVHYFDPERRVAAGSRAVRRDEWWVPGHIPGRPLFPGVLMIEAAAQLSTWLYKEISNDPRFFGFGGLDDVRFRGTVEPGDTLVLMAGVREVKSRRAVFDCQGSVNGRLVFQAAVTGVVV